MPGVTNPPDRPVHPSERRGGRRPRFRVLAAGTAAAAILLATGCSSDDGDDDSASTTTVAEATTTAPESTSTTTTEPRTPEEKVEEAYWEAERVLDDLYQAPDSDDPRLAETRIDPSLTTIRDLLSSMEADEVRVEFSSGNPPSQEILTITVNDDEATLTSCLIDDSRVVDAQSGEVLNDSVESARLEVSLQLVEDTWKVAKLTSTAEWADGLGCDR